jgi:hypothetical protein
LLPASSIGALKQNQFKMQTLELNKMGLAPMEQDEMREHNGGFLPLAVIYGCWGVMAACSLAAAAFNQRLNEYKKANAAKK